jgi:hypothetical protein
MKILFLTGHRKSGTSMFSSLFDGHKDFCVYPTDLSILYAYYPYFIKNKHSYSRKKKRLLKVLKKSLSKIPQKNKLNKLSKKNLNQKLDIKKMINNIEKNLTKKNICSPKLLIKLIIESFVKFSLYKNKKFKYFVFKETSIDMFAFEIKKWFKNVKFIQIVRDPRDNFASLKSGLKKKYSNFDDDKDSLLASMLYRASLDFNYATINKKIIGIKNYNVVRFEDLTSNTKIVMKKICKFLNVKFHNSLVETTILGESSSGNSFENKKFLGKISKINVNNWSKRISKEEVNIIEFFMNKEMKIFNYKLRYIDINHQHILNHYQKINKKFFFKDSF